MFVAPPEDFPPIQLEPPAPVDILPLVHFSHTPPATILGRARWPNSLEYQAFPGDDKPTLKDVLIWVQPYLEQVDRAQTRAISILYRMGPEYGPLYFYRPWSPHRR